MESAPRRERFFRSGDGRLRLGWRLALFVAVALLVGGVTGALLGGGVLAGELALLVGAITSGVFLLTLDDRPAAALGFYVDGAAASEGALGVALGAGVALLVVGAIAVAGGLRWAQEGGSVAAWLVGCVGALAFLAVPAAAEEALLRGYPLQALAEAWGPWAAISVTAGVFGALHLFNPNLTLLGVANVTMAGVFLGVIYIRTGSLWWATGAHLGWNWAHGYLADVPVSGLELLDAPFYEGVARGPDWLGGAQFGPEGSVLSTVALTAAALWCWRARWLRPSDAALAARPLRIVERPA